MTWVTITGEGITTATVFHGDVMNKINNMLGGVDVTDTVTINAAVTWQFDSNVGFGSGARLDDDINLINTGTIGFENAAGTANFTLQVDAADRFSFDGDIEISQTDTTPNYTSDYMATSPADSTTIQNMLFKTSTDTTNSVTFTSIKSVTGDVTNATSSGLLELRVRDDNAIVIYLIADGEEQQIETYVPIDIIVPTTTPADPAADRSKLYAKQVDTNNDGYFIKENVAGAITEVRIV